jgi:EAL domain-containing protein (putative c-di-GMP-specific phosphodiesterase class I)
MTEPSRHAFFSTHSLALENAMPTVLTQIISSESLRTYFQPIVSLKRKAVVGAEALARASEVRSGRPVPPGELFELAGQEGRLLDLDRLCRRKALESFYLLHRQDPSLQLFINLEVSILAQAAGSWHLRSAVREARLDPASIVIEINESEAADMEQLKDFVARYKEEGFLIALDDLGVGHSNLQRWPVLQPDIVKVDRSLIHGLAENFYQQEILKSLTSLARQTGTLVLAEGVEGELDVVSCMEAGVDLFQGFFFGKPSDPAAWNPAFVGDVAAASALKCRDRVVQRMRQRRLDYELHQGLISTLVGRLDGVTLENFDAVLRGAANTSKLDCLYVLASNGQQVSQTIFPHRDFRPSRGGLFQGAAPGTDHSGKEYFYGLAETGMRRFFTDPYISLATGRLCRTLSQAFEHPDGKNYIICADIRIV